MRARWPPVALHRHAAAARGRAWPPARGAGRVSGRAGTVRPTMALDQLAVVEGRGVDAAEDDLAAPQHACTRSAMARASCSLWVMMTTDRPLARSWREAGEEGVDLLGGEHAGGLVEDDELGPGHQHLEDLDPLALADGQVADEGRRVAGQPVAGGGLVDLAGQAGPVEAEALPGQGQGDVLGHGQAPAPGAGPGTPCRCRGRGPRPASRCSPARRRSASRPSRAGRRRRSAS